jgi:hypothetical protein
MMVMKSAARRIFGKKYPAECQEYQSFEAHGGSMDGLSGVRKRPKNFLVPSAAVY